ncbi:MAG: hypothetical protein NTX36_09880, partial [Proteobacteria bacterium]|nr:hypothetical protein [Pseudomonadota bacterium]
RLKPAATYSTLYALRSFHYSLSSSPFPTFTASVLVDRRRYAVSPVRFFSPAHTCGGFFFSGAGSGAIGIRSSTKAQKTCSSSRSV